MPSLFTIKEMPTVCRSMESMNNALDRIVFLQERQRENRHVWDRRDARDIICRDLKRSIADAQRLLSTMEKTNAQEMGR